MSEELYVAEDEMTLRCLRGSPDAGLAAHKVNKREGRPGWQIEGWAATFLTR